MERLTERQIFSALQESSDSEAVNADFADEEQPVDECTDSENDNSIFEQDSSEDEDTNDDIEELDQPLQHPVVYVGRDGTEWQAAPFPRTPQSNRRRAISKVNLIPGKHLDTASDCFCSVFDQQVIDIVIKYTNIEAKKKRTNWKEIDRAELLAFIGLLIIAGVDRSSKRNYEEFFGLLRGMPIFRATMGLKRFKDLLRFMRFDDKGTRSDRRSRDKLAPIRDVFDLINRNLKRMYSPGQNLTIDEQLVPFRGRCSFKQYIPSKPDKYGLKIFWICDAKTFYPLNAVPYLGRERSGSSRQTNIGQNIVIELSQPYFNSNRTVTFDNFFTNYELAQYLKNNGMNCVGTVRKNKKFIPTEFLQSRRCNVGSNLFGFRQTTTLLSHIPRQNRSVIFLSTLHRTANVEADGKAEINVFYNKTKGGVDTLDELCHTYSVQRKTNRWPFAYFMNLINVSCVAAFVLWRTLGGRIDQRVGQERKKFLTQLSSELTYSHIVRRSQRGLSQATKETILHVTGGENEEPEQTIETPPAKKPRRRCYMCPSKKDRKIKQVCDNCRKNICNEHAVTTLRCKKCATSRSKPIENSSDSE